MLLTTPVFYSRQFPVRLRLLFSLMPDLGDRSFTTATAGHRRAQS